MKIITKINQLQKLINKLKSHGKSIGFVPTMGALHDGHLSLMKKARRENDIAVASVFVNQRQFNGRADFRSYPRNKRKDVLLAKKEKIDIMFYPSAEEMYPNKYFSAIEVNDLTNVLCGKFRPNHFKGVTTIVGKLLNIVSPDTLYLGQKDFQQCVVIHQMIKDLNWPIKLKALPIIREKDGLALSSRNKNLSDKERKEALVIYQSLKGARKEIANGKRSAMEIKKHMRHLIRKSSKCRIEYIECVDADTLKPLKRLKGRILIALALWFGKTRLIDNIVLRVR